MLIWKTDLGPGLRRKTDDGKEHSVDVEVAKEPLDDDAVDGE